MDSSAPAAEAPGVEAQAPAPSVEPQPDVKPIDTSTSASAAAPSSEKTSSPPAASLGALLKATPSSIDAFLSRLHRCLQTRAGADVVLFFLCYATRLSAAVLGDLSRSALRQSAQQLLALATKLPPSTTVTFSGPLAASPGAALAAGALKLAAQLKTFSAMVSEIRTFGRLWGLLGLYLSAKKLYLSRIAASNDEKKQGGGFATAVSAIQIASLISFQASENTAFLASKKVISLPPATTAKIARWGVRSWMFYVFSEVARHLVERGLKVSAACKKGTTVKAEDAEWDANWKRDFFRNLAWAPLTVHWAVDDGPLNELAISLLAMWPASGAMRDLWRANA